MKFINKIRHFERNCKLIFYISLICLFFITEISLSFSIDQNVSLTNQSIITEPSLRINEIYANPEGSDNNKEFVEIFGSNNLTNFLIGDTYENDSLTLLQYKPDCNYSLIVEEGFNYANLSCSVYSCGATIGNGLSNTADEFFLYFNETLINSVSYSDTIEGKSFGFIDEENFSFISPTPCQENFKIFNESEEINNSFNMSINESLNLSLNQSLNYSFNESLNESLNFSQGFNNTLNNTINNTINNTNYCNVSLGLDIKNQKKIYFVGDKLKFYNFLSTDKNYEFVISYWIEDYFNNSVKTLVDTENTNMKQWTIKTDDKYGIFKIRNILKEINCSNINKNISNERFIFVVNKNFEESDDETNIEKEKSNEFIEDSSFEFNNIKLSDSELSFYVDIFKGETRKRLVNFFVECEDINKEVFEVTKIKTYVYDKQLKTKLGFSMSLNLEECDQDLKICAEGLDNLVCEDIDFRINNKKKEDASFSDIINTHKVKEYSKIKTFSNKNNSVSKYFDFTIPKNRNEKNNVISGSVTKTVSKKEVYFDSKKIVNYVIIGIMIVLLFFVFLKN